MFAPQNVFFVLILLCLWVHGTPMPLVGQTLVSNSRLVLGTEKNKSASIRLGDLDGDGDLDAVVANGRHWPQTNFAFLNTGNARFNVMRPIGLDSSTSYACELADLDGDGDLDIATGNDMAPCQIYLNDGQANFRLAGTFGGISSIRSLAFADVDGDGDQDILATSRGRANQIFLNDGSATFRKSITFGTRTDSTIDVAVGDVDADGDVDLLLANRDGQPSAWLMNTGGLEFTQTKPFGDRAGDSRAVVVGDFNRDGKMDWALANIGSANQVFLGDAQGGVLAEASFGSNDSRTYCLAAADMNGDGWLDLIAGNAGEGNAVYFNQGDGQEFVEEVFDSQPHLTYGLSVGDLNADGRPDVAIANSDTENQVFINRSTEMIPAADQEAKAPLDSRQEQEASQSSELEQFQQRDEYRMTDWPSFRGLGARGVAEGFALPASWNADPAMGELKNVQWQIDVPGLGHSSPVVIGDQLFLLTAVAEDGEAPLQVESGGRPTAADDNGVQQWLLLCYDKNVGDELWRKVLAKGRPRATRHAKATHANTSVSVAGERVISFLGSEGLYCHDLQGNLLWRQDLGVVNISKYGIGWGFSSSPAVLDDQIVLVCDDPDNPFLSARRLSDGAEIWRTSRQGVCQRSWGTPLIHPHQSGYQVVVNGWPWVVSYRLSDGAEVWRIKGGGDNPIPSPFEAHGLIYVTNAHGGPAPIYAVRPNAKGELQNAGEDHGIAWSVGKGGSYMSTPVVYGDQILLGNSNGVVRAFHARTGEKLEEKRLGSKAGVIASLVAGDGKIFCASENGTVYVFQYGKGLEVIAENAMGHPCLATPAISEGTIFIRSTKQLTAIRHGVQPRK